jgi:large subunit ribosomal protein L15
MPLQRRLPKRGFTNIFKKTWIEVQLAELSRHFEDGAEITPETLAERGIIKKSHLARFDGVVILGGGDFNRKLNVTAHRFTKAAKEKIEAAGGTVSVVGAAFEA